MGEPTSDHEKQLGHQLVENKQELDGAIGNVWSRTREDISNILDDLLKAHVEELASCMKEMKEKHAAEIQKLEAEHACQIKSLDEVIKMNAKKIQEKDEEFERLKSEIQHLQQQQS